jgi:hypothetical protein
VPAKTTNQLYQTHGQYLDASTDSEESFNLALNEVMPRLYKMGYWREMLVEHTQEASAGYVSLPPDTDSIIAAVIDNSAVPTRSMWHDYKLFGTNDQDKTNLSSFIDDGYAPTYRDLDTANQYTIKLATLKEPFTALPSSGTVTIRYRQHDDATQNPVSLITPETVLKGSTYSEMSYTMVGADAMYSASSGHMIHADIDISEVISISWVGTEEDHPFIVKAKYTGEAGRATETTDTTKDLMLADINTNNGVSRYRRYRIGGTNSTSSAHMLLKRCWVDVDSVSDLVYMPSNAILKHALLGKLSEDNADLQRAVYHWGVVKELLEADTDSYRGAAKPTLHIAPDGVGGGMSGMY